MNTEENILSGIYDRIKSLWKKVILANKELIGNKKSYWKNKTQKGEIKNIRPIESAAGDLTLKQKNISLEIFLRVFFI